MICKVCGKQYRKGKIVYAAGDAGLVRQRVCPTCAGGAVLLLVSDKAATCRCGAAATVCSHCVDAKVEKAAAGGADIRAIARKIRLLAKGYEAAPDESEQEHLDGRVAGLEQAVDIMLKFPTART